MNNFNVKKKQIDFSNDFLLSYQERLEILEEMKLDNTNYATEIDDQFRKDARNHIKSYDAKIVRGEIILLSGFEDTTYALVMNNGKENWYFVTPFSPYMSPATDEELLTDHIGLSCNTLQVWNSRTVPKSMLINSWHVDYVSDETLDMAWELFFNITIGDELTKETQLRIGAPIAKSEDLRLKYKNEVLESWRDFDSQVAAAPD